MLLFVLLALQSPAQLTRHIEFYNPDWSPDGKTLLFESTLDGKFAIYAIKVDGSGLVRLTSDTANNDQPRWSHDGRELFYRDAGKNQLMAVDIQADPAFRAGQPHSLLALGNIPWDVAPDGKRFLVVKELQAAASEAKLQAVVNWFEELRQKAPKK